MSQSSWRMGGGHLQITVDEGRGQVLGSKVRLAGRILGMQLDAECEVLERDVPRRKTWQTIGEPHLLVVGPYRMGFRLAPLPVGVNLQVFIDYDLPAQGFPRLLGRLVGDSYAAWCTRMMVADARCHFAPA